MNKVQTVENELNVNVVNERKLSVSLRVDMYYLTKAEEIEEGYDFEEDDGEALFDALDCPDIEDLTDCQIYHYDWKTYDVILLKPSYYTIDVEEKDIYELLADTDGEHTMASNYLWDIKMYSYQILDIVDKSTGISLEKEAFYYIADAS